MNQTIPLVLCICLLTAGCISAPTLGGSNSNKTTADSKFISKDKAFDSANMNQGSDTSAEFYYVDRHGTWFRAELNRSVKTRVPTQRKNGPINVFNKTYPLKESRPLYVWKIEQQANPGTQGGTIVAINATSGEILRRSGTP